MWLRPIQATPRFAMSAIEAVIVLGIVAILILIFFPVGVIGCKRLWLVLDSLINWPYL